MLGRIWKFPWLRSRSQLERGVIIAVSVSATAACATLGVSLKFFRDPSQPLLLSVAGIGATFYIAYVVGMSGLVRDNAVRDGETANFVGYLTASGICGLFGIGFILVAAARDGQPLSWIERFGFAWGAISLFFLGVMVGALPLTAYEAIRSRHANPEE